MLCFSTSHVMTSAAVHWMCAAVDQASWRQYNLHYSIVQGTQTAEHRTKVRLFEPSKRKSNMLS
jgi:hypothetical protein